MVRVRLSVVCLSGVTLVFAIISKIIFDKIYITSNVVIDEEFHLALGKAYCNYEFHKWHPKVTTFPGLYMLSSALLGPLGLCEIYWLRAVSLLFSIINILLFYWLLGLHSDEPHWKHIISAVNIALLPPLYFFSHLYYTDVASVTMILSMFILAMKGHHYTASLFGVFAVLFRQTNIIWVGMAFAFFFIKEINRLYHKTSKSQVSSKELVQLLKLSNPKELQKVLREASLDFWLSTTCYASVMLFFVAFVILNGSIVVGDQTAHEATVHLPQLFYFSLFCLFFAWPVFIGEIPNFFRFLRDYKLLSLLITVFCMAVVHFNTQVHPYVLADNRHYIFYIWNRFYGHYTYFRYAIVPIYLFAVYVILNKLWRKKDVTFLLLFIPCTFVVLITQRLLEFRYFFIPYILFRLNQRLSLRQLVCEFLSCCAINVLTLYLFYTKSIYWSDYDTPQKLIW